MGVVYLAVTYGPGGFSKLLVVKELRPELGGESAFLQMFLDEARLAARLNHANVVHTYEVGEDGGRYFMAMEYLEGQTLHRALAFLRRQGRAMPRALQLRAHSEVLLGLHYAHELRGLDGAPLGVVHRDVSPHNVFLTYDGQVKLVDFGIAKALDACHETVAGTLKGKVTYMAPEQARDASAVDRRVDVFAAGAILWETLAGRKLWDGAPVNEVLVRLTRGDLPPGPAAFAPDVPPELDRICAKAIAADREARYPTALAFREALERYMVESGEGATAHELGAFISAAFADERAASRSQVDAELTRLKSGQPEDALVTLAAPAGDRAPFSVPPGPLTVRSAVQSAIAFAGRPDAGRTNAEAPPSTMWRAIALGLGVVVASSALTAGALIASRGGLRASRVVAAARGGCTSGRFTLSPVAPCCRYPTSLAATNSPMSCCASSVEPPMCGVRITLGSPCRLDTNGSPAAFGSSANTSTAAPAR